MQENRQEILEIAAEATERIRTHLDNDEVLDALAVFNDMRGADQAAVISVLDPEMQRLLFSQLDYETAGEILNHLDSDQAVELVTNADPITLSLWLDRADATVAAHILRAMPAERGMEILEGMTESDVVAPLLEHADDTAGGIMTPEFVALKEQTTAAEALSWLRKSGPEPRTMNWIFVTNLWNRLRGVVALSDVVLAKPDAKLRDLADPDVIYVLAGTDQEECARIMERYDISNLPVVDRETRLLGTIRLEDVVEVVEEEATEDMYYMVGLSEPERLVASVRASVQNRLPWLTLNLATVGLAAGVISLFESTIAQLAVAAAFLPVIAGQGGVGGTQTLTIMIRGLALGEIEFGAIKKALIKEALLGLINGAILGLVAGVLALMWKGSLVIGLALGVAMVGSMMVAGLSGVAIPMGLKLLRVDPALASVVFVTTITDVFGFLCFLGLVALLLPLLG